MRSQTWRQAGQEIRNAGLWLGVTLLLATAGNAQQGSSAQQSTPLSNPSASRPSQPASPLDAAGSPFGVGPSPMRLEKLREEERHKRLQADTTRLLELINELKTAVDKAGKNELSVDVVKKAAEIEKLARDVKDRMRS